MLTELLVEFTYLFLNLVCINNNDIWFAFSFDSRGYDSVKKKNTYKTG